MKKGLFIVCMCFLFGLNGCGLADKSSSGTTGNENTSVDTVREGGAGEKTDNEKGRHLSEQIASNISVDADVEKEPRTAKIHKGIHRVFSKEVCVSTVLPDTMGEVIKKTVEQNGCYDIETANGFTMFIEDSYFWGSYPEMEGLRDAIFYLNNKRVMSFDKNTEDMIPDDIMNTAMEYMEKIVSPGENESIQAVTAIAVESREKLLHYYTTIYPDYEVDGQYGIDLIKEHYGEEEQLYYLEFTLSIDDIPFMGMKETGIHTVVDMDNFNMPNQICMILSDREIKYLSISNVYKPEGAAEEELLSVDEAVEILKTKYNQQLVSQNAIVFDRVWLEYLPLPSKDDANEFELTPYWCFQQSVNGASVWSDVMAERINAVTGGDLSYGK